MQFMANATKAGIQERFLQGGVTCLASEERTKCWSGETTKFTSSLAAPTVVIQYSSPAINHAFLLRLFQTVYSHFVDTLCGVVLYWISLC